MKIVVFGAGNNSKLYMDSMGSNDEIVAVLDNDTVKHGKLMAENIKVFPTDMIKNIEYDSVVVTPAKNRADIVHQLVHLGVPNSKISLFFEDNYLNAGFACNINPDGDILARNGEVQMLWKYDIEESIAKEIFSNETYNFQGMRGDFVVIDVGMNVGIASLYFAKKDNVKHVYGFEPFLGTYSRAMENLSLNPLIAKKITPYNFGLGNADKTVECVWMEHAMGGNRAMHVEGRTGRIENVHVKNAGIFLGGIEKNPRFGACCA